MKDTRLLAAIDVGSNSVRLLIARQEGDRLRPVKSALATTRLLNGLENGVLSEESINRTARAVAEFTQSAVEAGAQRIDAFGTSALRDAANQNAFCQRVFEMCSLRVQVISGKEEACLAYAAAAPMGRCGVVDIGGGSTELIVGVDGAPLAARSSQMGAVRLMNALEGRLDAGEMLATATRALREDAGYVRAAMAEKPDQWVGIGGSITTMASMTRRIPKYLPGAVDGCPLAEEGVAQWLHRLCSLSLEERRQIVGLPPSRADIIPYGAAILLAVIRLTGAKEVFASDRNNMEGYIRTHMRPLS